MRFIDIAVLSSSTDSATLLSEICARMGSLAAPRMTWGRVIFAAGMLQLKYSTPENLTPGSLVLSDELADLAAEVVPEEGDPHPQRARLTPEGDGLITPSGVTIRITRSNITIDFGRDSEFLAACVLFAVGETTGNPKALVMAGAVAGEVGPVDVHLMF